MQQIAPFRKKLFAMLLQYARGDRTVKEFAKECGISCAQLQKLENAAQDNPPRDTLLKKIAANSTHGVEWEDFLAVCGLTDKKKDAVRETTRSKTLYAMFEQLTAGQQKTVYDFMEYLLSKPKQ